MIKYSKILCVAALLSLTACGDLVPTTDHDYVPYTMERTAGHGVAYVRAKMLPPKNVVVKVMRPRAPEALDEPVAPPPSPQPVMDAEPMFEKKLTK